MKIWNPYIPQFFVNMSTYRPLCPTEIGLIMLCPCFARLLHSGTGSETNAQRSFAIARTSEKKTPPSFFSIAIAIATSHHHHYHRNNSIHSPSLIFHTFTHHLDTQEELIWAHWELVIGLWGSAIGAAAMARSTLVIAVLLLCVVVAAPRSSSAGGSYLKFFSCEFNGRFWCLRG